MAISFFEDGNYVDGVDYGYTPQKTETKTFIIGYEKKIEKDEETGEEKEIEVAITEEREEVTEPEKGRKDCIFVYPEDLPAGHKAILIKEKK